MTANDQGIELRCSCSRRPLLAFCGSDPLTGEPWVHIKVFKGQRIYGEVVCNSGIVKLRCRECGRWQRVKIVRGAPRLRETTEPPQADRDKKFVEDACDEPLNPGILLPHHADVEDRDTAEATSVLRI